MTETINSKTLLEKVNLLCDEVYKHANVICDAADLKPQERDIFKKYIRGFLTYSKRASLSDLPLIKDITRNISFKKLITDFSPSFPFLNWIRFDLSITAYIFSELQSSQFFLDPNSEVWRLLLLKDSTVSSSSLDALFDYINEFRPSQDVISKITAEVPYFIESTGEETTYLSYPALSFFAKFDTLRDTMRENARLKDFSEFAHIVMLFMPEEKEGLFTINCDSISLSEREKIIESAEMFAVQYRAEYPELSFSIKEKANAKPQFATHTKVNYDTLHNFSKGSFIQSKNGKEFLPLPVANYIRQKEYEEKMKEVEKKRLETGQKDNEIFLPPIEMDPDGESKAISAIWKLAAGRHNLTAKDARGSTFETSFYKLYKLVSTSEPHVDDMLGFIGGFFALTRPRLGIVKGTDENGKLTERRQVVTFVHLLGNTDLENILQHIEQQNKDKKAEEKNETLGKQIIKFTLDDVLFTGFRNTEVENKDGKKETTFTPIEHKKALLLPNIVLDNGITNKKLTFISLIKPKGTKSKKGHMTEADLLSAIFGYEIKLLLAREKDRNKDPLPINPKTGEQVKAKDWESLAKRDITANRSNNKKYLKKLFDEAVQEGVIVSYAFKERTKVYEWTLVEKETEQTE